MTPSTHVLAFCQYSLCTDHGSGPYIAGQWREVIARKYEVDCEVCKLVLVIIRANRLEPLFNSDQRKLAAAIRELLK